MITTFYAALLAIFYLFLTARIVAARYKYRVGLGDGGNEDLARRIRVHGNFSEYVPFALILLFFVDDGGASPLLIHILGVMLLAGRVLHAWGVAQTGGPSAGRMFGMILTLVMIAVCAILLLWKFIALQLIAL